MLHQHLQPLITAHNKIFIINTARTLLHLTQFIIHTHREAQSGFTGSSIQGNKLREQLKKRNFPNQIIEVFKSCFKFFFNTSVILKLWRNRLYGISSFVFLDEFVRPLETHPTEIVEHSLLK